MKKLDDIISSLKRSHGVVVGLTTLSSLNRIYENVHDSELLECKNSVNAVLCA